MAEFGIGSAELLGSAATVLVFVRGSTDPFPPNPIQY
jgi:hypothetical protein